MRFLSNLFTPLEKYLLRRDYKNKRVSLLLVAVVKLNFKLFWRYNLSDIVCLFTNFKCFDFVKDKRKQKAFTFFEQRIFNLLKKKDWDFLQKLETKILE